MYTKEQPFLATPKMTENILADVPVPPWIINKGTDFFSISFKFEEGKFQDKNSLKYHKYLLLSV